MRAAKYVDIFMFYHFYEFIACRSQIFAGVKLSWFLSENLADHRCHGQPAVTVDVNLAHRRACCSAQLLCRYTHRTFQFAPVSIDQGDVFGRY
jgi:hypothetical protein